ncbi:MAG: DUF362 domain-containing protein [Planctomycetaceae bacterium]|nr:DUF362 domain-containing protein [Planctomycetaceae bacterium]
MNRRDFLKSCLAAGVGLGMARIPFLGDASAGEAGLPDIVAVRNGEPDKMFDAGIAAMGGMGRFVRPGQVVALKPNVSWDVPVEMAANTHPALVNRVARHCIEAGAKQVLVFDNTIEYWQRCYEASGIRAASADAGARIAPAEAERYYVQRDVGGQTLKSVLVHEAVLEADVLISLPVLKHHGGAGLTGGIKNFMGAVWDRNAYHSRGLAQSIADFLLVRKPDLTVLDAYRVLTGNGPRSRNPADVSLMKMQILSTDVVAADASGARLLGRKPEDYEHLRIAGAMGFGTLAPETLVSRRVSL